MEKPRVPKIEWDLKIKDDDDICVMNLKTPLWWRWIRRNQNFIPYVMWDPRLMYQKQWTSRRYTRHNHNLGLSIRFMISNCYNVVFPTLMIFYGVKNVPLVSELGLNHGFRSIENHHQIRYHTKKSPGQQHLPQWRSDFTQGLFG